jgi:hypothetical protein
LRRLKTRRSKISNTSILDQKMRIPLLSLLIRSCMPFWDSCFGLELKKEEIQAEALVRNLHLNLSNPYELPPLRFRWLTAL